MDYSQLPNDPDHPAGSSPWNSSPQHSNRPSYVPSAIGSEPSSPITTHTSYQGTRSRPGQGGESYDGTLVPENGAYARTEDSEQSQAATENGSSPDLSTRLQSPPLTEGDFAGQQRQYLQQQQQQRQHSYQQQQRPNRYQGGNRAVQRQNAPQYKLQAKITGLERTGRKDSILRFDVYVRI